MNNEVAIIGNGALGRHLSARLRSKGVNVCFSLGRNLNEPFEELLSAAKPAAVFLAISTLDKGEAARDYILTSVKAGIPVITCEKGALAYHAEVLKPHLDIIGFSATVGGGTMMLRYVKERHLDGEQVDIHAVLNGTLNFIFDEIRRGRSLAEACGEASKLGYAEPGATDPLNLINAEFKDVKMKTCVFFNTLLAQAKYITPDHFGLSEQRIDDLEELSREGGDYRLVVSFSNHKTSKKYPSIGKKFDQYFIEEGWAINGSFRQISDASQLSSWLPSGVGNAVHIIEGELGSGGKYTLSGPGAGHEPTTSAMLADFERLCR